VEEEDVPSVVFSDAALMTDCALAFRLRRMLGFQPRLAVELGYGKAVHHLLRLVAEHVMEKGRIPTEKELDWMFASDFYLPAANRAAHAEMKASARGLIDTYLDKYGDELHRVWAVERPFELHLGEATITGRADVILETDDRGEVVNLAIVDYKTSADEDGGHDLQLQVYTDAGRREGLAVRAAYVHDLKAGDRIEVPVDDPSVLAAEQVMKGVVARMRSRTFPPSPGLVCRRCDVRAVCKHAAND
ncbi:MAG: RecB family exonuclease, partial [bacterium]